MWNKLMEICGFVLACIMAIFLGKSHSAKKQAEKEAKEALKKEKMKVFEEWKRVERLKVAISRSAAAQCSA